MGWLELIALLKRVLPLLSKLAPLLEGYVGARGATRGDSEAIERLSADLNAQIASATQHHNALKDTLDAQSDHLQHLADELQRLRAADAEQIRRFEQVEHQIASTARVLRTASIATILLLLACASLLTALVLRR